MRVRVWGVREENVKGRMRALGTRDRLQREVALKKKDGKPEMSGGKNFEWSVANLGSVEHRRSNDPDPDPYEAEGNWEHKTFETAVVAREARSIPVMK